MSHENSALHAPVRLGRRKFCSSSREWKRSFSDRWQQTRRWRGKMIAAHSIRLPGAHVLMDVPRLSYATARLGVVPSCCESELASTKFDTHCSPRQTAANRRETATTQTKCDFALRHSANSICDASKPTRALRTQSAMIATNASKNCHLHKVSASGAQTQQGAAATLTWSISARRQILAHGIGPIISSIRYKRMQERVQHRNLRQFAHHDRTRLNQCELDSAETR